ncbi:MAG: IS1634 family transposase [Flavobacterium sp.]|uniref:IS1634 family transposase n=1 Tax=Myroides oncorhynchi TaxID=2893756 RepID=UPI001E6188FC|nr:IS1634 family transposase [Myroides oncorhynchi]MCC9042365.1 IS1634 family transposase [Myroides oncorhynchi]MCC9042676.1 IS1634 family transposase [Myroides oncorhynchi]
MYKIRKIKYSQGSVSVQVYKIENRKRVIVRHIGTSRDEQELENLLILARDFIQKLSKQLFLFTGDTNNQVVNLAQVEFLGVYYNFFYELMHKIVISVGFDKLQSSFLLDLAIIRMLEPSSKLRSISLLEEYFGIKYRRQKYYDFAPKWLELQKKAEQIAVSFAQLHYNFDYKLVFYDVTTLYFETFESDELRKNGFSKDNKSQQPQILVALMVTKDGLPISYDVFAGNTFEGHTFIPMIEQFIRRNQIQTFTVVADAAMISLENSIALNKKGINFIVGARLANLPSTVIQTIDSQLPREDGKTLRIKTVTGDLICSFSSVRFRKDKYEMEKQLKRAEDLVNNPGQGKKLKFTKSSGENMEINQKLVAKTTKLLGVKGYYTNLPQEKASDKLIIEQYKELYRIEQAFRISKSDLQTRPIFHYKEEPIKLHILICFIALVLSKHIELQTNSSIKTFIHECKKITDARLKNKLTGEEFNMRASSNPKIEDILSKLEVLT